MNNKYYLTRKRKYDMEYKVLNKKKKHRKLHNKFSFQDRKFIKSNNAISKNDNFELTLP